MKNKLWGGGGEDEDEDYSAQNWAALTLTVHHESTKQPNYNECLQKQFYLEVHNKENYDIMLNI